VHPLMRLLSKTLMYQRGLAMSNWITRNSIDFQTWKKAWVSVEIG
jgi:hypothetical protein